MAISETVLILAGGTAVLATLFGIRLAMRAGAGALRRHRDRMAAGRRRRADLVRPTWPASSRCRL